jgi:MFS superfamily sulfate permease-like transporter
MKFIRLPFKSSGRFACAARNLQARFVRFKHEFARRAVTLYADFFISPQAAGLPARLFPRAFHDRFAGGLTVGTVALPLAIGFGIAAGATPGTGIFTAIIGGFIISALGGSRVQIGGPAGAFVGLVYSIITHYGMPNLLLCTAMAGMLLFLLGLARLGSLIKFIPHPITTGFTCGIAITIISTQAQDFLGLKLARPAPAEFLEKMLVLGRALPTFSGFAVAIGVGAFALIKLWPKTWAQRVPGSIFAILAGTLAVSLFKLPVETIGGRFGEAGIPRGLPAIHLLSFDWRHFGDLVRPAVAIALLGSIESLLSAVVADGMIDDRHDSNQELMAQGVANLVVPFFGGIPVTGVIARTATNVRSGARTPVAAVTALDGTALAALETLEGKLRRHGRHLILSGLHAQPYRLMVKAGFVDRLGKENVVADLETAVARSRRLMANPPVTPAPSSIPCRDR